MGEEILMVARQVVILLGAPGAGKGTQAQRLAAAEGLPHVSTGDLFRANLGQNTELGRRAKGYMESGQLVPDELVVDMLFDRVSRDDCRRGYLLDGFPRTLPQAEALSTRLGASSQPQVVELEVDDDVIVRRAAGRLTCSQCGHIQHREFSPPKVAGVCDQCGGSLTQRKDDQPEVVRQRLAVYHEQTKPLSQFYANRGQLVTVDGGRQPDQVFAAIRAALQRGANGASEQKGGAR
jgi:adenylate kinase